MKVSVITINLNNADGLRETMESVQAQTSRDYEFIVVDGASTDGSLDVIEDVSKFFIEAEIPFVSISEPDHGIYEAMNKGIGISKGDYLLFLNSGDWFVEDRVLQKVIPSLDGTEIVQGNVLTIKNGAEIIDRGYGKSDISFLDVYRGFFLHQATFTKREVFERHGLFDESYKIIGDTVFYARCLGLGNATFKYVDVTIAYFDNFGISSKWTAARQEEFERYHREVLSERITSFMEDAPKKIALYDTLHAHKLAWYSVMLIMRLIKLFRPSHS